MAGKDYFWNAEALAALRSKELDAHYAANGGHYAGFAERAAKLAAEALQLDAGEQPQDGDVFSVLRGIIELDTVFLAELRQQNISDPRRNKWISQFTWYVVRKHLGLPTDGGGS